MGYSTWGCKELDINEATELIHTHAHTQKYMQEEEVEDVARLQKYHCC